MILIPAKPIAVADFLAAYADDPRYELIDGELRELHPTGPHEEVAGELAAVIKAEIKRVGFHWTVPKSCLIQPPAAEATVLRPDVIALDREALKTEPLWQREPILTSGQAIRWIAEVVSTNWQDDYARKLDEYALLGVEEYWIVDFRGLGGVEYLGKPKQPALTVCTLAGDRYTKTRFWQPEPICSTLFPNLELTLADLLYLP